MKHSVVFIDDFSTSIDDLTEAQQADNKTVLRCLERDKQFSVFDVTANQTIATTVERLAKNGFISYAGGVYPWTKVEITDKGRTFLSAPSSTASSEERSDEAPHPGTTDA
jgi:hypothetical protein